MPEVPFGFVVLVELVLSVESAGQTAAVDFLLVDPADNTGTFLTPFLDLTLSSNG